MTARPVQTSLIEGMERPVGPIPLSVQTGTNADLMWAIRDLYLGGSVLDVTYGEGKWWDRFKPDPFTAHDLYKLDGIDFRALPEPDSSVDCVCFDPPYVNSGGESSAALGVHFQGAYGIGLDNINRNGRGSRRVTIEELMIDGLRECVRVSRRWVLVKCMEYAQGGSGSNFADFHDPPHLLTVEALRLGCRKHDQIVHNTGTGPGGHNIYEAKRARRAHSYLLVFKVPEQA